MEEWRNIDGMYSTVGIEPLHRKRYTKEEVSKIAQKYTRMVDFAKGIDKKYYYCAYRHGWLDDICKHMEPRADIFRRDIYVYDILYQGKKYAYVGLTYNVEHRHKQHLRDSRDAIFKFKHKTGCEIPYPEILYRNLDVDSASKKEDEMIQEYKSHGYIMLNRIKGGSTGGLQGRSYTWDECKEIGKKYRSLHEWEKNESKSYYFSRYHFHDELIIFGKQLRCNREDVPKFSSDLTDVELVNLASKYKKRFDFCREHKTYYNELVKRGLDNFVFGEMLKCKKILLLQDDKTIYMANSIVDMCKYLHQNICRKRTLNSIKGTIRTHLNKKTKGKDILSKMNYTICRI